MNLVLVKLVGCWVITAKGVGGTTWKFDRFILLCLLYLLYLLEVDLYAIDHSLF